MDPNKIEIGEPRWRAVTRLLIWLSVVAIYYASFLKVNTTDASLMNYGSLYWVLLLAPLFLISYLSGIIRSIRKSELFVFDRIAGDLRKNGISVIRLDQIIEVRLKAVNGICEELSLSVQGEGNISIELPEDGPPDKVSETARAIAAMAGVKVLFSQT